MKGRTIRTGAAIAAATAILAGGAAAGAQAATATVGGGTWSYGSYLQIWPPKTCYSDYKHNSAYHSSTAMISRAYDTDYANAGYWSRASSWAGAAYTCYTYWNKP